MPCISSSKTSISFSACREQAVGCTLSKRQKEALGCRGLVWEGRMKETIQLSKKKQVLRQHSLLITLLCAMLLSKALPHNLGPPAGFPEQHPAPISPAGTTKVSR